MVLVTFTCGTHFYNRITSLRGRFRAKQTSLHLPFVLSHTFPCFYYFGIRF